MEILCLLRWCVAMQSGSAEVNKKGFTLVEIMIVVGIIAVLCALALPSFLKARLNSRASAEKNDLRILEAAFQLYAMEHHGFPAATWTPGVLPTGMSAYVKGDIWSQPSPIGGSYAWKLNGTSGVTNYYISLSGGVDQEAWDILDKDLDDGNPATGKIITGPADHAYFLDQ